MFDLYAQGVQEPPGTLISLLPILFIFIIFYFLLIRPNSKKQKLLDQKRNAMKKGDKVIVAGGIYGKLSHEKEEGAVVVVEIAPQVKIEVVRSSIVDVLTKGEDIDKKDKTPSKK